MECRLLTERRLKQKNEKLDELETVNKTMRGQLARKENEVFEQGRALNKMMSCLDPENGEARDGSSTDYVKRLWNGVKELKEHLTQYQKRVQELEEERDEHKNKAEARKRKLTKMTMRENTAVQAKETAERLLEEERGKKETLTTELEEARMHEDMVLEELGVEQMKVDKLTGELEEEKGKVDKLTDQLSNEQEKVNKLNKWLANTGSAASEHQQARDGAEKMLGRKVEKVHKLTKEKNDLKKEMGQLQEKLLVSEDEVGKNKEEVERLNVELSRSTAMVSQKTTRMKDENERMTREAIEKIKRCNEKIKTYNDEFGKLKNHLRTKEAEWKKRLEEKEREGARVKEEHLLEMTRLRKKLHQKKASSPGNATEDGRERLEAEIKRMNEVHRGEVAQLQAQLEKERETRRRVATQHQEEHQREVTQQREEHQREVTQQREEHQREVTQQQEEHRREVAELQELLRKQGEMDVAMGNHPQQASGTDLTQRNEPTDVIPGTSGLGGAEMPLLGINSSNNNPLNFTFDLNKLNVELERQVNELKGRLMEKRNAVNSERKRNERLQRKVYELQQRLGEGDRSVENGPSATPGGKRKKTS